jgi:hypothetical protein
MTSADLEHTLMAFIWRQGRDLQPFVWDLNLGTREWVSPSGQFLQPFVWDMNLGMREWVSSRAIG